MLGSTVVVDLLPDSRAFLALLLFSLKLCTICPLQAQLAGRVVARDPMLQC